MRFTTDDKLIIAGISLMALAIVAVLLIVHYLIV
jgi:hypothetical protein